MKNMKWIKRLRGKYWREERLLRELAPWDSLRLLLAQRFGLIRPIRVRMGGEAVFLRTNTSDVRVAYSSLLDGEYALLSDFPNVETVVDAGANIGTSAISFARMFPSATIIAIEPEIENYQLLQRNVEQFPNVRPVLGALATSKQQQQLIDPGIGPWGFTLISTEQDVCAKGQKVECFRLTDLLNEFGVSHVSILKLDIEGGERDILNDSSDWIDKVDAMVVELHDRFVPGCTEAFENAVQGFKRFEVSGEKRLASRE